MWLVCFYGVLCVCATYWISRRPAGLVSKNKEIRLHDDNAQMRQGQSSRIIKVTVVLGSQIKHVTHLLHTALQEKDSETFSLSNLFEFVQPAEQCKQSNPGL